MIKCIANKPLIVVIFWTGTPSKFGDGEGVFFCIIHAILKAKVGYAMTVK